MMQRKLKYLMYFYLNFHKISCQLTSVVGSKDRGRNKQSRIAEEEVRDYLENLDAFKSAKPDGMRGRGLKNWLG